MSSATTVRGAMVLDGVPLRVRFRRAELPGKLYAFALVAPLLLFLLVSFVLPILSVLQASVRNPELGFVLPTFREQIQSWSGEGLPPRTTLRTFIAEAYAAERRHIFGRISGGLNNRIAGFRSLIKNTGEGLLESAAREGLDALTNNPDPLARLMRIDPRWGESRYWVALQRVSSDYTWHYLLRAVDREQDVKGRIVRVPETHRLYVGVFWRTLAIGTLVTAAALLLGFPVAYLLAELPTAKSNLLLLIVLFPLWTSILIKSAAWLVVLQNHGLVNDAGLAWGLWDERVQLIRNRLGTVIAMTYVLLPFMVLPLFSVMKAIDPFHMRAAATLGASPLRAFLRIYLPQVMPGIASGALLVFILALGNYVTPSMVGGPSDQMLNYFIARNAGSGLSASLSILLLAVVAVIFVLYQRIAGFDILKFSPQHARA